jgi:glycosyltransferase involved in cell wall biosynthesis
MRRLALICQHFYPEMISTGMHMTELATGLSSHGWFLRVYCASPVYLDKEKIRTECPQYMEYEGIEIVRIPVLANQRSSVLHRAVNGFSYLMGTTWSLLRDRQHLYGVINTTNPPFLGLAAILARWLVKLKFITIVYDVYPEIAISVGSFRKKSKIVSVWDRITRLILNQSSEIVVIGRDMEQVIRGKLKSPADCKVKLIPNWSNEDLVYPVAKTENRFIRDYQLQDRFVIQYSGRMGRTHNLESLLEAAYLLHDEPVLFQFIGDGFKRNKLENRASELGLTNIQFLPYQPFENLSNVLSAPNLAVVCLDRDCTGFSVPSKTYGIMAAGVPILAFLDPESEIGLTVRENDCGIVLPNPTADEVASLVLHLMSDSERIAVMGNNGRRAFLENYTLGLAINRYDNLLKTNFNSAKA